MRKLLLAFTAIIIAAGTQTVQAQQSDISPTLAREIATETYIWGYPLVVMTAVRKASTNVEDATSVYGRAPINQFVHTPTLVPAEYKDGNRANDDTLFDMAWLDLAAEPLVMTLPT